jgi:hypothetical protein
MKLSLFFAIKRQLEDSNKETQAFSNMAAKT